MGHNPDDFKPCPQRSRLAIFQANGEKDHTFRCMEQTVETANQDVTPDICGACPIRGLLMSREYKPPVPKPRAVDKPKKDTGGEGFKPCGYRMVANAQSCCGGLRVIRICDSDESHQYQGEVTPSICAECPVRKP